MEEREEMTCNKVNAPDSPHNIQSTRHVPQPTEQPRLPQTFKQMIIPVKSLGTSYLQSLHHLPDVLAAVVVGRQHDALPALVEDLDAHDPRGPADDVAARAVEDHVLGLLLDEHDELVGDAEQAVHVHRLSKVPGADAPGDGPDAEQVGILPRLDLLLLLGSQGDEAEFDGGVDGGRADKVLCQVPQVLLPCARGHGAELLRLVSGVLPVDDLGKEEVPEDSGFGEGDALGDGRAERRHVFRSGYSHTGRGTQGGVHAYSIYGLFSNVQTETQTDSIPPPPQHTQTL